MRMLVTGASGFVGAHLCQLASANHEVFGVYFRTPLRLNGVNPVKADLRVARGWEVLDRVDADVVIHVACKIKAVPLGKGDPESPAEAAVRENRQMMDGILRLGKPVIYASSTVVHWEEDTPYARIRREDERRLEDSGIPYAIVRPSAPYGPRLVNHKPGHKESFHTLVDWVRHMPIVPVIGSGKYRRQPVHVHDFARAIIRLAEIGLPNRAFEAGGANALTFDEIIDVIGKKVGRGDKVRKLHLPVPLFVKMAGFNKEFDPTLVAAIEEDEVADPSALTEFTGVAPRLFEDGVRSLVG